MAQWCTLAHTPTHVHTPLHMYSYTCTHTPTYKMHLHIQKHVHMHRHMHRHMHTSHTHTHHTHTHTHIMQLCPPHPSSPIMPLGLGSMSFLLSLCSGSILHLCALSQLCDVTTSLAYLKGHISVTTATLCNDTYLIPIGGK